MRLIVCGLMVWAYAAWGLNFEVQRVKLAGKSLQVEIADTDEKRTRGLMYRKKLSVNSGMLFKFEDSQLRTFWSKNTFVDLSLGFFDDQRVLQEIHHLSALKSEIERPKSVTSRSKAKYVLEVSQGWFKDNSVKVGARLELP